LYGYAYHPGLKSDAERAVKRASRVDRVVNKIEDLPPAQLDDDLRWKVYYAIYRDPFLSRYAPGGGTLWGHRHGYSGPFGGLGPSRFPGTEPAGDFPIHIIVKGLQVTLLGVVDNDGDKNLAGMKARGVPGGLGLENELAVEKSK
jgi:hyperosmotically inducible protein